jgi:eukaryotic-like serine/threonine-protein kinase
MSISAFKPTATRTGVAAAPPAFKAAAPSVGAAPAAAATATSATAKAEPGDPSLPRLIGKYVVKRRLGEGSTSEVFLAHDPFGQVDVAIKRVRVGLAPGSREQHYQARFFAAEAALVGQLHHPNVVQIFDAVADAPEPYLVMEYVSGGTLRRFCRPGSLLPLAVVIEIGFKCAKALGYCYQRGLIHRDVKPANLLVTMRREHVVDVKVTDFGSVFNSGAEQTQVYRVGSLAYMSPEQLDGDALDCRADIYSLGAVLYHLVAGRPPFDAEEQPALMNQIFHATPPSLADLREGVPQALQSLIEFSLAKDPGLRPASWDEVAQALSALVARRQVPRVGMQEVLDSERFTLLRALDFFANFGEVGLWEVVHRATWKCHPAGHRLYRKGDGGNSFHVITQGQVEVVRDGAVAATLGPGSTVGEMAYLAPSPELRLHSVDVAVTQDCTTLAFTPERMLGLSADTRHAFDKAFIASLVRRLHAAHEALAHPRRIL